MKTKQKKQKLLDEIAQLEAQIKPKNDELNNLYQQEHEDVSAKIKRAEKGKDSFSPTELIFAAGARCSCGAGFAYPEGIGPWGSWYCSNILMGRAVPWGKTGAKEHDQPLPFSFYEIKSENQPSAQGQTTRPEESR